MQVAVDSQEAGTLNIQLVEPARVEAKPSKPHKLLTLVAALLVGIVVGCGVAVTMGHLDQRIYEAEEATALGLAVVGTIPHIRNGQKMSLGRQCCVEPMSLAAEAYRMICAEIHYLCARRIQDVAGDFRRARRREILRRQQSCAIMALSGHRTLLVDADFRKPSLAEIFALPVNARLVRRACRPCQVRDVIHAPTSGVARFHVLPSGAAPLQLSDVIPGAGSNRRCKPWPRRLIVL